MVGKELAKDICSFFSTKSYAIGSLPILELSINFFEPIGVSNRQELIAVKFPELLNGSFIVPFSSWRIGYNGDSIHANLRIPTSDWEEFKFLNTHVQHT